jgi:hypothetical protein
LIASGMVEILSTKRKIRALRYIHGKQKQTPQQAIRKPGMGSPHRRETYTNPRGVWAIDHIPESSRGCFTRVLDECLTKRAA